MAQCDHTWRSNGDTGLRDGYVSDHSRHVGLPEELQPADGISCRGSNREDSVSDRNQFHFVFRVRVLC